MECLPLITTPFWTGRNQLETFPSMKPFPDLDEANVSGNRFTELPAAFGACTNLAVFEAAKNQLKKVRAMVG